MRNLFVFSATVALCALLLAGCNGRYAATDKAAIVKIDTAEVSRSRSTVEFPARVKAAETVDLSFKVAGTLQRVLVDEGDRIRKGQLLAVMDDRDYALALSAAEGEYRTVAAEAQRVISLYSDSVVTADKYDKARYGLQQIEAKYENAKNALSDTKLFAPFDGSVERRYLDAPTVVAAGMPVLALSSGAVPYMEIEIPASVYLRRGEISSLVALFDFLAEPVPLSIANINPNANSNQLYTVRLRLPSSLRHYPSPGMNAMVRIDLGKESHERIEIPLTAIFERDGRSCVWIYGDEGTISLRLVSVEKLHSDGRATVSAGIAAGEKVVSAGVHSLHEGQKVGVLPAVSRTNVGGML